MPLKDGAPPRKQDLEGCEHRNNPPGKKLESTGEKGLKIQFLPHWTLDYLFPGFRESDPVGMEEMIIKV